MEEQKPNKVNCAECVYGKIIGFGSKRGNKRAREHITIYGCTKKDGECVFIKKGR